MTRKHIALVGVLIVATSVGSALVAYRRGLQRGVAPQSDHPPELGPPPAPCLTISETSAHTGEPACVSGRVLRVFTSAAGNTFLDFCPDYRTCPFASVIFAADRQKFGDLQTLAGQQVEIHGVIGVYRGRPQIVIRDPEQIRVVR